MNLLVSTPPPLKPVSGEIEPVPDSSVFDPALDSVSVFSPPGVIEPVPWSIELKPPVVVPEPESVLELSPLFSPFSGVGGLTNSGLVTPDPAESVPPGEVSDPVDPVFALSPEIEPDPVDSRSGFDPEP